MLAVRSILWTGLGWKLEFDSGLSIWEKVCPSFSSLMSLQPKQKRESSLAVFV